MIETIDLYDPENVATELAFRRAQVKELRAVLEAVEWIGTKTMLEVAEDGGKYYCPWCYGWGWNHPRHFEHCARQSALAHTREPG
jgi:hypothetical protein